MPLYLVAYARGIQTFGGYLCPLQTRCHGHFPPFLYDALTALHAYASTYSCHALSLDYHPCTQHCRWPISLLWKQSPSSWSRNPASTQIRCWCWTSSRCTPPSSLPTTSATAQWWAARHTLQQLASKSSWELPTMLFPQAPSLGSMPLTSEHTDVSPMREFVS